MNDLQRQAQIRDRLVAAVRADIVGPMGDDEVLEIRPSSWYLAGFLVPHDTPIDERQDPLVAEAMGIGTDEEEAPEDEVSARTSFLPASMGLSFFVGPATTSVSVTVSWADYGRMGEAETRLYLEKEAERRAARSRKRRKEEPSEQAESPTEEKELRIRFWRRTLVHKTTERVPLDQTRRIIGLQEDREVFLQVAMRPAPAADGPPGTRVVSLFLVNGREATKTNADERYLFQTRLEVHCPEGFHPRVVRDLSGHPDERRADLQMRERPAWAVGHGVAAEVLNGQRIATNWLPAVLVEGRKTREVAGVETGMRALAERANAEGGAGLTGALTPLLADWRAWIRDQAKRGVRLADPIHRETAVALVADAERMASRMEGGIRTLARDPLVRLAFARMNTAMAMAAEKQRPGTEAKWRLFQLAFLLTHIDGMSDPAHPDREVVDLLFFPTGGGKTEAYLGVSSFALFLRRLRGQGRPDKGLGVAVLLRYTLRLLTLDQLNRATQLTCAMELLRRAEPEKLGRERFSVGVWVGRKATANRLADLRPTITKMRDGRPIFGEVEPVPLKACSWCGTPFGPLSFQLFPLTSKVPHSLVVSCMDETCPFHLEQGGESGGELGGPTNAGEGNSAETKSGLPPWRRGLPVVTVDEQVYEELPGFLIGTVDKFAGLPWRGASGNLFGRVRAVGSPGGPQEGQFVGRDAEKVPKEFLPLPQGLLPPELILQDELHLITGPLGTMVGLYETAVDALCRDKVPQGPKIIASTATARRAGEQIRALYGREQTALFPPPGIDDADTYFAMRDERPERGRMYLGVAAPGRATKLLASRVYAAALCAARKQWEEARKAGDEGRNAQGVNLADPYMTLVCYFNALRELGGAQRILQEEVNGRTRRFSERRPIDQEESAHFADRFLSYDLRELTSRERTEVIAETANLLRNPWQESGKQQTDALLASSMISVGVDIPRLGLMVVNGQPRTVAEYIQTSSRVGREGPGLVITLFSPYKPRDRSHYERFEHFHQTYYRNVEAASVTPFSARALQRGLPGLLVGLARHLGAGMAPAGGANTPEGALALRERLVALLAHRARGHRNEVPEKLVEDLLRDVDFLLGQWRAAASGAHKAATKLRYSSWESTGGGQSLLSTAVDDISKGALTDHLASFRAPTSMRDVEAAVNIWVDRPMNLGRK